MECALGRDQAVALSSDSLFDKFLPETLDIMRRIATILILALWTVAVHATVADRLHYRPDGDAAVCTDGKRLYNRALYGAHSGFRMECSDVPVFGIYLPGMGGHIEFTLPDERCTARYTPGRMDYEQGGVEVQAQVLRSADAAMWRIRNNTEAAVSIPVKFGGVSGRKFYREGDLGVDAPDCFDLKPEYCKDNVITVSGDRVTVEYGSKERKMVYLVIPANGDCKVEDNVYTGVIELKPGESRVVGYFPDETIASRPLDELSVQAEREREQLASTVSLSTPDPYINPIGGALAVAADGIWSGEAWLHGSIGWRTSHLGWRGAYCGDALGWHERALKHFDTYARNQITDIPPVYDHPRQDAKQHLARAEKKWGTPMYSNGYICRRPGKKNEMSHYDMNLVYADAMLRHFMHTGDTAAMRRLFPVLKLHLEWEKRNFDPDGDHLYDAYCCIWASDALYYSGGAVTHSSAYNYFANMMTARVARIIGEDPSPYEKEAEEIKKAIDSELWMPGSGCWAEYRELGGHGRLHPYPALWTVYHAIDSRVGDRFQQYAATRYIDSNIPRIPLKCDSSLYTLSTTSWKPYSWSINNVAIAEVMHTALAYWMTDRADDAYAIMKGVVMDNMYSGASPLNFGQISQYDAARGECYRDFADPIGVWSRAVTEGLFGIRPDMLRDRKMVVIRPGFPSDWDSASVSLPELSYRYERKGMTDIYTIEGHYPTDVMFDLQVPALGVDKVSVNGMYVSWIADALSISEPRISLNVSGATKSVVKIDRSASRAAKATGRVEKRGPVDFVEMASGRLRWWKPEESETPVEDSLFARAAATQQFQDIEAGKCDPVDISRCVNASVSDIFRNKYLSPRPGVTTLQIPEQGIGEWCHPALTAEINDEGLRKMATDRGGRVDIHGIPFAIPASGDNVLFTTLWDNYTTSADIPLSGKASHIYLLMAGSTNHMQWGMENARLTVSYADGTSDSVPVVNPVNWAPIEQDFYTDGGSFVQPSGTLPPMRVDLLTGEASRDLGEKYGLKGPGDRMLPGGAAILLDIATDPGRELKSVGIETLSQDVVAGIMGVTLQRPHK